MGNSVHFQSQASDSYEANKAKLIKSFEKVGPASKCNPQFQARRTLHLSIYIYTQSMYMLCTVH